MVFIACRMPCCNAMEKCKAGNTDFDLNATDKRGKTLLQYGTYLLPSLLPAESVYTLQRPLWVIMSVLRRSSRQVPTQMHRSQCTSQSLHLAIVLSFCISFALASSDVTVTFQCRLVTSCFCRLLFSSQSLLPESEWNDCAALCDDDSLSR